jgi:hypothetical protein
MASASASIPFSTQKKNKRIVWFWQSNRTPWDLNETNEWKRYSDFETDYIEDAYQRNEDEAELNDYLIDFKHNVQIKKSDKHKQRPVKREEVDLNQYVREERFSYPEKAVKSFSTKYNSWSDSFIGQWVSVYKGISGNYRVQAEFAAQGKTAFVLCRLENL